MIKDNGEIVPALHCATCPINGGCSWGCLRGDDLAEIAKLRASLKEMLEHGERCNWFADHLDEEVCSRARAALA